MEEIEVINKFRQQLESDGFKCKGQPSEGDVVLLDGEIRLDIQAFRESTPPELLWIEAKGSGANLKDLICDFVSLLLVLDRYGGNACLIIPKEECGKIIKYKKFLDKLQNNISKGKVEIISI